MKNDIAIAFEKPIRPEHEESPLTISRRERAKVVRRERIYEDAELKWGENEVNELATTIINLVMNDPFLMAISDIYPIVGIGRQQMDYLRKKWPRLESAIEFAKPIIGMRRERAAWLINYPLASVLKTAHYFLEEYQEARQIEANIVEKAKVAADAELMKRSFTFKERRFDKDGNEITVMTTVGPTEDEAIKENKD